MLQQFSFDLDHTRFQGRKKGVEVEDITAYRAFKSTVLTFTFIIFNIDQCSQPEASEAACPALDKNTGTNHPVAFVRI